MPTRDRSGRADPSHPPEPTHNHIFLCGGLGEWLHRSLGGISPASDGYSLIRIAPRISASLGPSAVNSSVETIRGRVVSSWARNESGALVRLTVGVPGGTRALVLLPLLGRRPDAVEVDVRSIVDRAHERSTRIWPQPAATIATTGRGVVAERVANDALEGGVLRVDVQAGKYTFVVRDRPT